MKQFWVLPTLLFVLSCLYSSQARLTETRRETRELQKALNHKSLVVVIDGVLERIIGDPSPDPLLLINFPDINTQFKVHVLEDSRKIKFTLAREDGKLSPSEIVLFLFALKPANNRSLISKPSSSCQHPPI